MSFKRKILSAHRFFILKEVLQIKVHLVFFKFIFYTTQFIIANILKFLCLQQSVPKDTETCFGITDYDETCKRYFVEVLQTQEKL